MKENARNRIIEQWFETHSKEKVVIFGAGKYGLKAKYLLETFFGVTVKAFGDNDVKKQGNFIDGIRCVSLEEI